MFWGSAVPRSSELGFSDTISLSIELSVPIVQRIYDIKSYAIIGLYHYKKGKPINLITIKHQIRNFKYFDKLPAETGQAAQVTNKLQLPKFQIKNNVNV